MARAERAVPYGSGRAAVIQAAIRIVAADGLGKLTFRSLAAEAGVSLGAIRHSFATINDVLQGALTYSMEQSVGSLRQAESVHSLFDLIYQALHDNPERAVFEVKVMIEAQHQPGLEKLAEEYYDGFSTFTREFLDSHGVLADDALVELLTAFIDGVNYERVVFGEKHDARMRAQLESLEKLLEAARRVDATG